MLQLKPNLDNIFICPNCQAGLPVVNDIRFESINVLAECCCVKCRFKFFQTFPVGHMVGCSPAISNGQLYGQKTIERWLSESFLKSHVERRNDEVNIEKIIFKEHDRVIILNALDSLYGHVLLKLYNGFHHLRSHTETGLIVVIPKIFKWLIPQGCAEAWVVDLKLNELVYGYDCIQRFVSREMERFQEVYLSRAYSHPDFTTVDIEQLTGVQPFKLENFTALKPVITFVLREDRWWMSTILDYWFYRICRKLKILKLGSKLLSLRQNDLVKRTITNVKAEMPAVSFYVVGLGKAGDLSTHAIDKRQSSVNDSIEKEWCEIYAQSHVVIGVHGSNMLLPTALAAGCVEIIPEDRYGNMIQDISVRYNNRLQLFFYRFADQFATPKSISAKAVSIIRDYEGFDKNMCRHVYSVNRHDDSVNSS